MFNPGDYVRNKRTYECATIVGRSERQGYWEVRYDDDPGIWDDVAESRLELVVETEGDDDDGK